MTFTAAAAVSSVYAGDRGSCTDSKCGGAAKECSEGSPHLQKKDMPLGVGSVDCDSCSGWKSGGSGDLNAIRIMPMGNSITLGVGGDGYREDLGGMLGSNATTVGHWVLGTHI